MRTLEQWTTPWRAKLSRAPNDRPALFAVAAAERLRYRYQQADSLYARVIALGADDTFARQAQLMRLSMSAVQGRPGSAAQQALAIAQAALSTADTLTALDALLFHSGLVLRSNGPAAAAAVLSRGDTLSWKREPALDAASRCRLATVRSRLGARDDARRLAREGEAIALRAGLERQAGNCLFTLLTDFARAGLSDSLGTPMRRTIEIQQRTGDMSGLAATRQWAGYYAIATGHYQEAQRHLVIAWDAAVRAGSADGKAWTALNRASLALDFFDGAAAQSWLGQTDSLMRALGDLNGSLQVARMRARLAVATGDTASAHRHLRDATALVERLGDPFTTMGVMASKTQLAVSEMRLDDAEALLTAELAFIDKNALNGWRAASSAARAALFLRRGNGREAERLLVPIIDGLDPTQHEYRHELEVKRALAMALNGNMRGAARVATDAARSFDQWRASLSDSTLRLLTVESQRDNGPFMSALIARLADGGEVDVAFSLTERQRARDLRDRLLLASAWQEPGPTHNSSESQTWRETDSVDVAALQRTIPDTTTALVTMDAGGDGERGTAFVLTRGALTGHAIASQNVVAPRVRRLVSLLEAGRDATTEAQALGDMLLTPIMPRLTRAGITRIVFIPEGVLHRLPFDVLRLPDGRTVLERFETAVAPSVTVLARLRASASRTRPVPQVLAIADPSSGVRSSSRASRAFGADSSFGARLLVTVFGVGAYPALAGTRDEVAHVQRALPGTTIRTGDRALESMFKREAATYDVLHFATHAVVDEWSGARAALVLTAGEGDDGLLDSGEIAGLRLNASLVVLSACRTVGGEVLAGEGVRGLTTAFLQAGARTVVATSWRVNDRAVVPLVSDFYDALARGAPVGAALRQARLVAMRRGAPVSTWGAFSIVGDPWRRVTFAH
ncbi:MAG: CHAT domain-containing protein [bacterium]